MLRFAFIASLLVSLAARADAPAVLIIADDGGLAHPEVHAVRGPAESELLKRGVHVLQDARFDGVRSMDDHTRQLLLEVGAGRVFALRVNGRLGAKLPLSMEELSADLKSSTYGTSLTAASIEECDVVVPRLVDSVLDRRDAASTATMTTVTAKEARPFQKKPGERFLLLGLPIALVSNGGSGIGGFSIAYQYEMESFRLGLSAATATNRGATVGGLTFDVDWIPLATELSPYFGAGLGYIGGDVGSGLGGKVSAGLEAFRLHGVRLLAGLDVYLPFYQETDATNRRTRSAVPVASLRFGW